MRIWNGGPAGDRGATGGAALEHTAGLLEEGLGALRRPRRGYAEALEARLRARLARRPAPRPWWRRWQTPDTSPAGVGGAWGRAAVALAAFLVLALGGTLARPALADPVGRAADRLGRLLQQLALRPTAAPPDRPVIVRDPPGAVQALPVEAAAAGLDFRLLVPTALPPGYAGAAATVEGAAGARSSAVLVYVRPGAEGRRWPALRISQHRLDALPLQGRGAPVPGGAAEAVRVGDREGVYVAGQWAFAAGRPEGELTPALHSLHLDADGVRVEILANRDDVPREELLRLGAALAPLPRSGPPG